MLDKLFKKKTAIKQLGSTLVALEVKKGKIPADCDGISLYADGSFDRHPAGDELKAQTDKRLILIHKGPYIIQYAPNDQTPEMGIEIELQIEFENEIGLFLSSWDNLQLSVEDLKHKAKQIAGQYILQPGMSQKEIDQAGGVLASYSIAMQAYGFRCSRLQRKDLQSTIKTAELLTQDLTAQQIVQKTATQQQKQLEVELGTKVTANKQSTPYFRINQFDQQLTNNLQRELNYINKQIQRFLVNDTEQTENIYTLQQQLQRCQIQSQMLPPLNSTIQQLKLTKTQQRTRLKQLQQAAQSLKEFKVHLKQVNYETITTQQIQQLIAISKQLENALKNRAGREA